MKAHIDPIGTIYTPYSSLDVCPNNIEADGPECEIKLTNTFSPGLKGLVQGDKVIVLYWLAQAKRDMYLQKSRVHGELKGVFALRSPHRPNPIGLAMVKILRLRDNSLFVNGLDCLSGTQVIDIKPA